MERSFWTDLALIVVTLGFYMPYWLWRRNADLREAMPETGLPDNGWWLGAGTALTLLSGFIVTMLFGLNDDALVVTALVNVVAILVFSVGVFILGANGERAADALGVDWSVSSMIAGGSFLFAFVAVQAGIVFPSLVVWGPAVAFLLAQPFLWYRIYEDIENVEAAALRRRFPPAPPPVTS